MKRALTFVTLSTLAIIATTTTTTAIAQDAMVAPVVVGGTQAWWQSVIVLFVETVAAIAAPVLVVLLGGLLKRWQLNIEKDKLEWIVGKAVGYGEQAAKKALKDGKPLAGPDILMQAVEKGSAWLTQSGLQKKWGSQLADLLEAKLGQHLINGQPK